MFSQNLGTKLDGQEKEKFEIAIRKANKELKSFESEFIIEKTSSVISEKSISKGTMFFENPAKLRWETFGNNAYSLIVNNDVVAIKNASGDIMNNSKMLKNLGNFIINIINGKNLSNNNDFQSEFYQNNDKINLQLIPIQKKIKDLYSDIIIEINKKNFLADKIILNEKSGDCTLIILNEKKIDIKISDEKFKIN